MTTKHDATIEDLYNVSGKAELVGGEIVRMSPTGDRPARAALAIVMSLKAYERRTRLGRAYPDNVGFKVDLPHRKSFSPDAAFYVGPSTGMKFLEGAPVFAAEVRSENDYGARAEEALAAKRADYFSAGTLSVWDVDLLSDEVVRVYRADEPQAATVYRRGEVATAEPALPEWAFEVELLFE